MTGVQDPRRSTPRTDHVLADPRLRAAADRLGREIRVAVPPPTSSGTFPHPA